MLFRKLCWIGAMGFLSYNLSRFPIIPLYAQSLGVRPELIGFVVAASTITGIPGKLLFGTLSDHWGRRRLLVASMVICSLIPFLYVFLSPGYALLLAIRFCHGLATAMLGPVSRAVVADLAKENERGTKLGIYTGANMIGTTIAPMLGGWLLSRTGFKGPFIASGVFGMIALALALRWPKDHKQNHPHPIPPPSRGREFKENGFFDGVRYILKQPALRATGVVEASKFFATGAIEAFLPIYASAVAHLNETQIGILFGVQVLGTLLTKPMMGWLSDRIGRRPLIIWGLLAAASLVWLIPHTQVFHLLVAIAVIYGVAAAAVTVSTAAFVTDLASGGNSASRGEAAPRPYYGSAHGVFGTMMDIGHAGGPICAGVFVAHLGFQWAFLIFSLVLASSAVVFSVVTSEKKR